MTHPLENKPDTFPAIASAWITAIVVAVGLWTLLHTFAPPVGWSEGLDGPVRVNIGFFGTMWHDVWANARAVSSVGSIAEFVFYIVTRPVASLAADGVLTQTSILLAAAMIAGRKSYKIVYQAIYRGLPRTRNVQTCIGSEPRYGGFGISHIEETWRDRLVAAGRGIYLAPGVRMPRDVEPEHVAVLGTTGAGKSTIVEGLLQQAIRRGDRCLIVDVKGHAKHRFNVPGAGELALGSEDGFIWAIGRDIRNSTSIEAHRIRHRRVSCGGAVSRSSSASRRRSMRGSSNSRFAACRRRSSTVRRNGATSSATSITISRRLSSGSLAPTERSAYAAIRASTASPFSSPERLISLPFSASDTTPRIRPQPAYSRRGFRSRDLTAKAWPYFGSDR
ncbi:type IV secretion system DNA-binding domain-containing protein [Bradyrhizobium sp. CCGB20]|uniref:type IV secretion system DNA-binding domain-containing protein n=1 Tax=Bradyrhizobium sp. CCGB20 TaxID=2949633 RepID=UPI0020B40D27|nr:type IV secretion system DNA-binding domain-containing protein [Bradyrhizobium sp. CCGB20]MCP3396906.1 type IV secretion system DNA-binding domain-containing protein [Bradyrhizobium sp. CCGB20]